MKKKYIFTSESVSEGHPDKVADAISDAILDAYLSEDPEAHVACEVMVTTGQVIISGEVKSRAKVDVQSVAREVIREIGYTKGEYMFDADSCGILVALHQQSADIDRGVSRENEEEQGAGDQGMMFGYAVNENSAYIPTSLYLSHCLMQALSYLRKYGNKMPYLRPDAKAQVSVRYEDGMVAGIDTVVISTQHDEFAESDELMQTLLVKDVKNILIPFMLDLYGDESCIRMLADGDYRLLVNPTGRFVIGGPAGDTGLTGRKIIVDTYGGKGAHGGGAFSGKDPSKVDRSAAYMARYIAKNMVAAGVADEMLVQVSYAIGVAEPVSVCVETHGTNKYLEEDIEKCISELFDLRPKAIEKKLDLRRPIYKDTSAYGHFGRKVGAYGTFPWESTNMIREIKEYFGNAK